jgi:hypothetical protein
MVAHLERLGEAGTRAFVSGSRVSPDDVDKLLHELDAILGSVVEAIRSHEIKWTMFGFRRRDR